MCAISNVLLSVSLYLPNAQVVSSDFGASLCRVYPSIDQCPYATPCFRHLVLSLVYYIHLVISSVMHATTIHCLCCPFHFLCRVFEVWDDSPLEFAVLVVWTSPFIRSRLVARLPIGIVNRRLVSRCEVLMRLQVLLCPASWKFAIVPSLSVPPPQDN